MNGPKKVFEGANHNVLRRLTNEKKTTTSKYLCFWSYGRISSCFWIVPPFMALFSGHSLRTTDPNFMFVSIFRNVLRCLIHLKHENKGLPLNSFSFFGKIAYFWTLMWNRQNYGPGTGPNLWDQTLHEKHATTLHILCYVGLTWLV